MHRILMLASLLLVIPSFACAQQATPDLSSPRATIQTFFAAIAARNVDVLAQCFSAQSEGEFKDVREKKLTDDDWREFQSLFRGATVEEVVTWEEVPTEATVVVALTGERSEERISVKREGEQWRIMGF